MIDLQADNADELIRDALRAERRYAKRNETDPKKALAAQDLPPEPTNAEVKARRDELEIEIRAERNDLEMFFENCTPTMPFSGPEGLRGLTRQDIEVFGYGYWEVIRNALWILNEEHADTIRKVGASPEVSSATDLNTSIQTEMGEAVMFAPTRGDEPTYTPAGPPQARLGSTFARHFRVFHVPRPWPLWMPYVAPTRRPVDPTCPISCPRSTVSPTTTSG